MLEVKNLEFEYADTRILTKVCFSLNAGEFLHLRGKNGSGKTTLLKLLAGLMTPSSGEICYQNQAIQSSLSVYQRHLCYVGHKPGVNRLLSLREYCLYDLRIFETPGLFETLIETFALTGLEEHSCGLLSAGQLRRAALLRLVVSKASLWLLDEPLVALDHHSSNLLIGMIQKHLAEGGMVILTSHQSLSALEGACYREYSL